MQWGQPRFNRGAQGAGKTEGLEKVSATPKVRFLLLFPGYGMEGGSSLYSWPNSGITRLMSTAGVTRLANPDLIANRTGGLCLGSLNFDDLALSFSE